MTRASPADSQIILKADTGVKKGAPAAITSSQQISGTDIKSQISRDFLEQTLLLPHHPSIASSSEETSVGTHVPCEKGWNLRP